MHTQRPKVSIVSITYNHEKFIAQAIDGFLMQKRNFPIEIIIADDASTDSTQQIIRDYAKKYPDIIVPILHKKNIGIGENLKRALMTARGTYVAMCEGDDFWTNSDKLQLQAEFLDAHPRHTVCFHPTSVVYEDQSREGYVFPDSQSGFNLNKLLTANFIHTSSVMYRRSDYSTLPTDILPLDWYLNLQHAKLGRIGFINKTMSTYRRNPSSVWFSSGGSMDEFWLTRGVGHAAMFEAVHSLFKGTRYLSKIENEQDGWMQFLVDLDTTYKAGLIPELCERVPLAMARYVMRKNEDMNRLRVEIGEANRHLGLVRASTLWRVRNKFAEALGRQEI